VRATGQGIIESASVVAASAAQPRAGVRANGLWKVSVTGEQPSG